MIKIEHSDIDDIKTEYVNAILEKLESRKKILLKLISAIQSPNVIPNNYFGSMHLSSLQSAFAAICASPDVSKMSKEDFISEINKLRISKDKRSICRKNEDLKKLKFSIQALHKKVLDTNLIGCEYAELKNKNSDLTTAFPDSKSWAKIRNYLFNYNRYRSILDNYLAKKLNVIVCPYCNRNYISYVPQNGDETSKEREVGPTYDHFFHKKKYKYLTLSFYNLVPSCYVCNSNLKGEVDFDYSTHLSPYEDGFGEDAFFNFEFASDLNDSKIRFEPFIDYKAEIDIDKSKQISGILPKEKNDHSGNVHVFKLQEIYKYHNDVLEDIHMNFDRNSKYYLGSIKDQIKKMGVSEAEFFRFHFKNYFDESDFNKRPLSKLTKDIYLKFKEIDSNNS